ncbi:MAG: hypothetical protein RL217_421 [Pseudomonadota bacterium]|jgi:phosphomannomutase/phosphoglucomutase
MIKHLSAEIFRAYDIRGIVDEDLTIDVCYWIGRAIGSTLIEREQSACNLAYDGRLSSPAFAQALQNGLLEAGCSVNFLGMQPTGLLYFSTHYLSCPNGVMITGSHNPANYNGIKIVVAQQALSAQEIQDLYQRIKAQNLPKNNLGILQRINIEEAYLAQLGTTPLSRPLKIVVDAGNGVAGPLAERLFKRLNVQTEFLFCDVDGRFPNHHPDPSIEENLTVLKQSVIANNADVGIAFDGDGDRTALVDSSGEVIWPDRLLMLLIQHILPKNPGRSVLFDVKSSGLLRRFITDLGGVPVMGPTGHSLMKKNMRTHNAIVGGEFSGHLYLNDNWFGFDDGLYVAVRLLESLSQSSQFSHEVFAQLPNEYSTAEITLASTEARKFEILQQLSGDAELLASAKVFRDDGLRLEFADSWGLVRASNTTPKLTLRFAGDSPEALKHVQLRIKEALARHAPELKSSF